MIILDTNVLSELLRSDPAKAVERWLAAQDGARVYFTTVGEAELRHGVAILPTGKRRNALSTAIEGLLEEDFRDRILPFDRPSVRAYATIRRLAVTLLASATVFAGSVGSTLAATPYPDRPVRLVVPFAPGGSTDLLARALGQKLGEKLGQPFLIDNRAGAGGTIGTAIAVKSNADGYTLVLGTTSTLAINESLYPRLGYDVARDLAPIVLLAKGPFVLMSTPGLPVTSLKELIAYAKQRPGKLSIASSGNGTSVHLSAELFKMVAQLPDIVHIPFKGGGPAGIALMAGEVQLMINDLPPAIGPIRSGKLRALAVADSRRSPLLPDVPTFTEAGLPGYESLSWFGLLAPAGTPAAIISLLNRTTGAILANDRDLRARFAELGVEQIGGTPAQLAAFAREETRKWSSVVKKANVVIDGGP